MTKAGFVTFFRRLRNFLGKKVTKATPKSYEGIQKSYEAVQKSYEAHEKSYEAPEYEGIYIKMLHAKKLRRNKKSYEGHQKSYEADWKKLRSAPAERKKSYEGPPRSFLQTFVTFSFVLFFCICF